MRLIDADALMEDLRIAKPITETEAVAFRFAYLKVKDAPAVDAVPVVRCKDCKHQEKTFHADKRMKNGGYYVYFCDLAEDYSHVCLDEDFCSKGERRDDGRLD